MKGKEIKAIHIASIAQSHQALGISKPRHPLFSILRIEDLAQITVTERTRLTFNFYQVVLKKNCPAKVQYGQTMYDFDEGVMSFFAPKQVTIVEPGNLFPKTGWILNIHPDFLRSYPLGQKMKEYGFFEYAVNEALILSEEEEQSVENIFQQIGQEYRLAAAGRLQFLLYGVLNPWDHAPGVLLFSEAGGHARLLDGRPYSPTERPAGLLCAPDEASWQEIRSILLD